MKRAVIYSALMLLSCARIFPDGFHVSEFDAAMFEPSQKAVISWDGSTEKMFLSSAAKAENLQNFCWVVPVRSKTKPNVEKGSIELFYKVIGYVTGQERDGSGYRSLAAGKGVEVIETKEIDIYDIAVLRAGSGKKLAAWLRKNGYKVPERASKIFSEYIKYGDSYFIANKVDLRNKYAGEIRELDEITEEYMGEWKRINKKINRVFKEVGIKERIDGKKPFFFLQVWEAIYKYVNSPENPLGLPPVYAEKLPGAIEIRERYLIMPSRFWRSMAPSEYPAFMFHKIVSEDARVIEVVKNGKREEVFFFGDKKPKIYGGMPYSWYEIKDMKNLDEAEELLKESNKFAPEEIRDILGYISMLPEKVYGKNGNISPGNYGGVSEKPDKFAEKLNNLLIKDMQQTEKSLTKYYVFPFDSGYPNVDRSTTWNKLSGINREYMEEHFSALQKDMSALMRGLATPIMIKFEPPEPMYPLKISSLNRGRSKIEVFIMADTLMGDRTNTLKVAGEKAIGHEFADILSGEFGIESGWFITRLKYYGDLSGLKSDAVFEELAERHELYNDSEEAYDRFPFSRMKKKEKPDDTIIGLEKKKKDLRLIDDSRIKNIGK